MNRRQLSRKSGFTASAAPRRAFTLVELLIVIVIIGMLAALITAAAAKAVNAAKRTQITVDLDQFETAFQSYRNDTSGNFPPDMSYPPATGLLASWQVRQNRIMAHLRKAYPRALIQGYGTAAAPTSNSLQAWSQSFFASYIASGTTTIPGIPPGGDIWGNVDNLDQAEALVFWIGGMPLPFIDAAGKWSFKMAGISANKQTPFAFGGSRSPGPYEFSPARLGDADGDGWPEYYPPGAAVPQPPGSAFTVGNPVPPYVYFDAASYDFFTVYDPSGVNGIATYPCPYPMNPTNFGGNNLNNYAGATVTLQPTAYVGQWGLAVPYAQTLTQITGTSTGTIAWVNDSKFQVISAGIDTLYASTGCGTTTRVNFPLFPTPQQGPGWTTGIFTLDYNDAIYGEPDNQANFTSGTLQDGSTQ